MSNSTTDATAEIHKRIEVSCWLLLAVASNVFEPPHGKSVLIAYANSKGSGEPAHPRSLARTYAVRSRKLYRPMGNFSQRTCGLARGPGLRAGTEKVIPL